MSNYDDKLRGALLQFKSGLLGFEETIALINTIISPKEESVSYDIRIDNFRRSCYAWNYKNKSKYETPVIESFVALWTRVEPTGKLRFESESTFKIGGRLATYSKLNSKFTQGNTINKLKQQMGQVNPLR